MKLLATAAVAFAMLSASAVAIAADKISLRPHAAPVTAVVRLCDVADIATGGDSQRAARLGAIPLMPTPAAGSQRFLRQREIQDMLVAYGEDVSRLRFAGADQVAIAPLAPVASPGAGRRAALAAGTVRDAAGQRAATQPVDHRQADQLRDRVRQLIGDYLAVQAGFAGQWEVTCDLPEQHVRMLAQGPAALKCEGGAAPWVGRQRFTVSFATAAGEVQISVLADVSRATPVVVAMRPIARGAVITAADVEIQVSDTALAMAGARRSPVESIESIVGLETARQIAIGEMIWSDQVKQPLLVKRGETVTVVAQGGGIRVRTAARAVKEGAYGDLVQVESLETRERYDVRVTGRGLVSVFTPSAPAAIVRKPQPAAATEPQWR